MSSTSKLKLPDRPVSRERFREMAREATAFVEQQRSSAQVAAETLAAGRSSFTEADGTRDERMTRTRDSALEFGRVYLPHYFEQEGAEFHDALDKLLTGNYTAADIERWIEEFEIEVHEGNPELNLLAICIPRGHGKSVIAILFDFLRRICHGLDPYLIVGSDTLDQAASQLEDIKDELASNEKIKADFGNLKPGDKGVWQAAELVQRNDGRVVWREGRIITTNRIRVDAIGRGGKMRGRRFGVKRPTHIVLDDLDNDENVASKDQRDKSWNWVISAVEPARDPDVGRVTLIGTVIHFDCNIARAVRKTDEDDRRFFTSIKFAALRRDDNGELKSVWESRFTTEKLLAKRALLGPTKFGAEYMNDPRDPETQVFNPNEFTYYPPAELLGRELRRILYVDPSKGKKGKGRKKSDFSGFADLLVDTASRTSYVRDAFRKRLTPAAAKSEVVEWYIQALKVDPTTELWVEENSFGDILGASFQEELRRRGIDRVINTLLHTEEKTARLDRHSIRTESGGVQFPQKWEKEDRRPDWFSEYDDYPAGAFDDTIDAIESADEIGKTLTGGKAEYKSSGVKQGSALVGAF